MSSPVVVFIRIGETWVRADQIESYHPTSRGETSVQLISGVRLFSEKESVQEFTKRLFTAFTDGGSGLGVTP